MSQMHDLILRDPAPQCAFRVRCYRELSASRQRKSPVREAGLLSFAYLSEHRALGIGAVGWASAMLKDSFNECNDGKVPGRQEPVLTLVEEPLDTRP